MFAVMDDEDDRRIVVAGDIDVAQMLALAEAIDGMVDGGSSVAVEVAPADQTLLVVATLARCRLRAERVGLTMAVQPEPRGEAARMWSLGLRDFLGLPPGAPPGRSR